MEGRWKERRRTERHKMVGVSRSKSEGFYQRRGERKFYGKGKEDRKNEEGRRKTGR